MIQNSQTMSFITVSHTYSIVIIFLSIFIGIPVPVTSTPHIINFRSLNLYPKSLAWDSSAQHFLVGSLRYPTILAVSDAGVVSTIISDQFLPANSSFIGIAVDHHRKRILAVIHSHSDPSNSALAAYDLRSPHHRQFITYLYDPASTNSAAGANDVTFDFSGNAFVTNSASNFIWKVDSEGKSSVFSASPIFTKTPAIPDTPYSSCGLSGIVYNSKGYLLVVQSNTGKLFKVDAEDGTARRVQLNRELTTADGIALRSDGVVLVVSQHRLYFVKSDNSWSEGVIYDETALDAERFASSVTVGGGNRVYVLYGHVMEGVMGISEREGFAIVETSSEEESGDERVWVYVLIGMGLVYFLIWRFQMRQLITNMNKKVA